MTKVSYEELLSHISDDSRSAVERWWNEPGTNGLVYFENSERQGEASVLAIGPSRRVKRVEDVEGTHLNGLPALRQYPRFYCSKDC